MIRSALIERLRTVLNAPLPLPGHGETSLRHRRLMETGREDLSLARLAEAHWDAVAILAEAGRNPHAGAIYGVWASEKPGHALELQPCSSGHTLSGVKMFCSGGSLIDRALVTAGQNKPLLVDLNLRQNGAVVHFDDSVWKTNAFAETSTSTATFSAAHVLPQDIIGEPGWYLERPGFWHGACGPAACWAGGAAGLLDYAMQQLRDDPHTLAHLGAMYGAVWAMRSYLDSAGHEMDAAPDDPTAAIIRAFTVRHLIEQACTDVLRRLPRAYGPHPLAFDEEISRRCQELNLYLRQCHAERDLESLGKLLINPTSASPQNRPD